MEKAATKSKNNIMKFLPRAASAVTFQNPPFSPGREKRLDNANKIKANAGRGFSGPIISIIPAEARRKSRKDSFEGSQEPTSPKVSCMGQIKHKKKIHKTKREAKPVPSSKELRKHQEVKPKEVKLAPSSKELRKHREVKPKEVNSVSSSKDLKRHKSVIRNIFGGAKPGRKSDASADKPPLAERAPSLSQMRRFASGRDTFANFDWTAQIAPVDSDHRNYYSDEEREDSEGDEEEIIIPFSAPMLVGGGIALEPRKEVNLWKRRTMAPPRPLQLNTMVI